MPPSKSKSKKTTFKKVKRAIAKQKKTAAKKNMDTKFVQVVLDRLVTPKQGVAVANYIYGFTPLLDSNGNNGVTSTDAFKLHATMYDRVRVNGMRITFIPKANTFDASAAQNDNDLTVSGSGLM